MNCCIDVYVFTYITVRVCIGLCVTRNTKICLLLCAILSIMYINYHNIIVDIMVMILNFLRIFMIGSIQDISCILHDMYYGYVYKIHGYIRTYGLCACTWFSELLQTVRIKDNNEFEQVCTRHII